MSDIDASQPSTEMGNEKSTGGVTPIDCVSDVSRYFPEYGNVNHVSPTRVGVSDGTSPDWIQDEYPLDSAEVVARLLASIENCIVVSADSEDGYDALNPIRTDAFDGILIGSHVTPETNSSGFEMTIRDPQHLIVKYAAARLLFQYEKELSHRVLHEADQRYIDAMNRKCTEAKRELRRSMKHGVGKNATVTVPITALDIYSVELEAASPLFNEE
jgi:hypothetical protein